MLKCTIILLIQFYNFFEQIAYMRNTMCAIGH